MCLKGRIYDLFKRLWGAGHEKNGEKEKSS